MKERIEEWIREHPIEAFFLFAIGISFVLMMPAVLIMRRGDVPSQILSMFLGRAGAYSPVLSGIFIARIIQPMRERVALRRRLSVFIPVCLVAAIIHTASLTLEAGPDAPLIGLLVISLPVGLLPAFVISSAFSGAEGVKKMLSTLVRPRGGIFYYLAAILTFPFIHIVGAWITNVLNGDIWLSGVSQGVELAFTILVTFFSVLLFSGGINEESGWRGFAQKRLQAKYSPLVTCVILWFLMVIWHIPNDIVQYRDGGYLLVRIILYPFITILFAWVYNRTHGSILAPAVFHASMNSMNPLMGIFPITTAGNIFLVGLAIFAVVSDRMWRRLPGGHPAVYQDGTIPAPTASSV